MMENKPKATPDYSFLEFLRFAAAVAGVALFIIAGLKMRDIRSVSGDSVAEVFYQAMGWFSWGMAALCALVFFPRARR